MAGRLPFNMQGHSGQNPLHDAQIRAALGLGQVDEALYLQQQRDFQRDFQLRQMLLQDQIDQQNRLDSIVVEQRLKQIREQLHDFPDLQQHYSQLLLRDRLRREQEVESDFLARAQLQQQEEFQRRALAQTQAQTQQTGSAARPQTPPTPQTLAQNPGAKGANAQAAAHSLLRDIAADSLAGNAIKRSDLERRVFAKPDENVVLGKKKQPNGLDDSGEGERKRKKKKEKTAKKSDDSTLMIAELSKVATELSGESTLKPSAQALLDFASSGVSPAVVSVDQQEVPGQAFGTLSDILEAAESEKRADEAVSVLTTIKRNAEWSDSEGEEDAEAERQIAIKKGDAIVLPNFTSVLPQLPEEPELIPPSPGKKKKKKHKGLMDDDSVGTRSDGKPKAEKREVKESSVQASSLEVPIVEYPYPIDPWWPSVSSIRKERKANGQTLDESENDEKSEILDESPFRANLTRIKEQLATDVAPGVLEKIPHCQIHRLLTRKRKNPSAPENVFCFQVTELYPNDLMVCCSHCGTWRHAACGGHYKPYSVRECIDTPFNAVCDRCHYEEKILRDHPIARRRIDRQRSEQIRRGLATSAAMRQASFSKHGGTYKWPLGSVSATHIGGHTRSVHHRHDKAEKQWMEMAQRLGRNNDKRPKERVKIRTKELERLLVAVEDAEGHTDRHNMMLFLLQDTLKEQPVGFEKRRRNIFDPEEDVMPDESSSTTTPTNTKEANEPQSGSENETEKKKSDENVNNGDKEDVSILTDPLDESEGDEYGKSLPSVCARQGCSLKPRFDSLFCSDSCGVACLEGDLLRTFQYTSDIHPSLLRN